jgi:hypothetical protein
MRSKKRLVLLGILLLFVVGCSLNKDSVVNKPLESKVTIKDYYEEPESLKDKQTIVLKGVSDGEFIEIVVTGSITDFEHIKLELDNNQSGLLEKVVINKLDKLTNQTIVIKTYTPEGIPSEKVKWKSSSGQIYEYIIQENGMDDKNHKDGTIIYLD